MLMIFDIKHVNEISIHKSPNDEGWVFTIQGFDPTAKEMDTCEYSTIVRNKEDMKYLIDCLSLDDR
jgi:hypothetical protein